MLHKIYMMLSKGLGFIYVFLMFHIGKLKKKDITNHKILVILGGHIGNVLLNIDAILELPQIFPKSEGWQINILCNQRIKDVCIKIADMSDFNFLNIYYPYEDGGTKLGIVWKTIHQLRGMQYEKIIVNLAHIMPLASYIVASIPSGESIGVFDDVKHQNRISNDIEHNIGNARWYFERAYSCCIKVPYNTQETHRLKAILEHLGDFDYQVKIYALPKLCNFILPCEKYVTVTIDSTSTKRRWETDKFIQVINYLLNKYDYSICITGGKEAEALYNRYVGKIEQSERVFNYIGKTSFDEWVELIRGSSFHLGVDSGSIHIAASVGTQAFCLIGGWDGKRALPYLPEVKNKWTLSPICIYMDNVETLNCYGCIPKTGVMGYGLEQCIKACRVGKPCYCLSSITVNQVTSYIDKWLGDREIKDNYS